MENEFKLSLEGDGISVKKSINRETALAILHSVMSEAPMTPQALPPTVASPPVAFDNISPDSPSQSSSSTLPPTAKGKPKSLREFVNDCEPKTNAQVILAIAQFLAEHEGQDRFKRDQIRPKFPSAGEALPKNFSRDFQTTIDKGWIGEDPLENDSFFVTRTGEEQIKHGFRSKRN